MPNLKVLLGNINGLSDLKYVAIPDASGAIGLNYDSANYFTMTSTGAIDLSVLNLPLNETITVELVKTALGAVTFGGNVVIDSDTLATLILKFINKDGMIQCSSEGTVKGYVEPPAPDDDFANLGTILSHYDFTTLVGGDGDAITSVLDMSDNHSNLSASIPPHLKLNAWKTFNGLRFNPNNTELEHMIAANYLLPSAESNGITMAGVFCNMASAATGPNHQFVDTGNTAVYSYGYQISYNGVYASALYSQPGGASAGSALGTPLTGLSIVIVRIKYNGFLDVWLNGTKLAVAAIGDIKLDSSSLQMSLTRQPSSGPTVYGVTGKTYMQESRLFCGDVLEVINYDGAISDAALQNVYQMLVQKYA